MITKSYLHLRIKIVRNFGIRLPIADNRFSLQFVQQTFARTSLGHPSPDFTYARRFGGQSVVGQHGVDRLRRKMSSLTDEHKTTQVNGGEESDWNARQWRKTFSNLQTFPVYLIHGIWMGGWMDGWMGGWVDGWMGGWMDSR